MEKCLSQRVLWSAFVVAVLLVATTTGCGDDDDDGDVNAACDAMCKGAGFTSSRLEEHGHETNCFCTGGSGTVSADACTNMCKSTGKPGSPFGSGPAGANACQCQ
ncbi:MAG: hypothetical protein KIS78_11155 [Labilithrix sp.]|nr:hypothetical protein [Labilithrix sp.]